MNKKLLLKNIFVSICQYNLPVMKELLYLKDDQLKGLIENYLLAIERLFLTLRKFLKNIQ